MKNKDKKQRFAVKIILITFLTIFSFSINVASAQTEEVKKAVEETRESVNELIEAKDEESPLDLGLRIETFKKAINLSIAEAKDLKVKLIAEDDIENEDFIIWREESLVIINNSLDYYEKFKEYTEVNKNRINEDVIKDIALQFKEEREEKFIKINKEIRNFLLIQKAKETIDITNKRWGRIETDLENLEEAEFIDENSDLWSLLDQSKVFIEKGDKLIVEAEENFYNQKIRKTIPDNLDLSIKDDLIASLNEMRSAYQVFIEMSNMVRDLLK
ncbi:MAG: hypothetical protein WDZ80_00820 [Candidatus Paceibacterota bacterium]